MRWLTTKQAAEHAGVSVSTIRRLLNDGLISAGRTHGNHGHWRIDAESIDALFKSADKKAVALLKSFRL